MIIKSKNMAGLSLSAWLVLLTLMGFSGSSVIHAATLTVDAGGTCALADAVYSANYNVDTNGCVGVGGYGSDTIILETDVVLDDYLPIRVDDITLECQGYTVNRNSVVSPGSAQLFIYIFGGSTLTVNNCTLTGGVFANAFGGAIEVYHDSHLVLLNSTLQGNQAHSGGALTVTENATARVENTAIYDNESVSNGNGGGISVLRGTLTLINSTVSGNRAQNGGGVYVYYEAAVTLIHSTGSNNKAENGGGIRVYYDAADGYSVGTLTLENSIVAGNLSDLAQYELLNDYVDYATTPNITADHDNVFGHNGETDAQAFSNFTPGTNDYNATSDGQNIALASILDPLADNGGTTLTHALVTGSPAIDQVANCTVTTDQRRLARPASGNACDTGAYEFAAYDPCGYRDLPGNTWVMTAPPCNPDPTSVDLQLREDLGGAYNVKWTSYNWDAVNQQYHRMGANEPLVQGVGNWTYSTDNDTARMRIAGTATPVIDCDSEYGFTTGVAGNLCFAVDLVIPAAGSTEQNMIGHPFPYTVDWPDVRVAAGTTGSWTLYTPSAAQTAGYIERTYHFYDGSSYQTRDDVTSGLIGVLHPQEAIWVRSINPAPAHGASTVRLLIPAQ
jgi:hypothetical protein